MLSLVFVIIAVIMFVLAAFDVHPKCLAIGLAFFAGAFAVQWGRGQL